MTRTRDATPDDAPRIAELSAQLGYPASAATYRDRLSRRLDDPDHRVIVAETAGGEIAGLIHVHRIDLLVVDGEAEIGALVVEETLRGRGVGQALLRAGERAARELGCSGLRVRTNVLRDRAPRFYAEAGFEQIKQSLVFRKDLG